MHYYRLFLKYKCLLGKKSINRQLKERHINGQETYISLYKSNRFKLKLFELFLNLDLEKNVIEVLKVGNEVSTVGLLRGGIGPNLMEKSLSPIILLLEI